MFPHAATEPVRLLLPALGPVVSPRGFYLAGGTAAALQLGHRQSVDLDFFSPRRFEPDALVASLSGLGSTQVVHAAPDTMHLAVSGVRVSFFRYTHPLLAPTVGYEGIDLASLRDIALMKLIAIAQRGSRKDFIDLYAISTRSWSLLEALDSLRKKFGETYSLMHILRSLQYFDDAEKEPELRLLDPTIKWPEVKGFFQAQVSDYVRELRSGDGNSGAK